MAGRKPLNPPRNRHGFMNISHVRCPDCEIGDEERSRLRNDGGAVIIGGQLRGASVDTGKTKASSGCRTCGGRGAISTKNLKGLMAAGIEYPTLAHIDPYALDVRAAIERRKGSK